MDAPVGYEFLRQSLRLRASPLARPAVVSGSGRIKEADGRILVPRAAAPATNEPLAHILFALKHEGTHLPILAQALPQVEPSALLAALRQTPTGAYIRIACWLWEQFAGQQLQDLPTIGGPTVGVFDTKRYVTRSKGPRDQRLRVLFNGLGSMRYCATVERTTAVQNGLRADTLVHANAFAATLDAGLRDRALAWAYLHETESSYAIERESPSEERARSFVALLHQAHEHRPLSEPYLVALQNAVLTNPFDRATHYRSQQNWLRGPLRGAAGITYLPPPPELVPDLMNELAAFANTAPGEIDPILAGSVISFGFVFIHPFMDGNGRLSRFLFHHALCRSGFLDHGLLLPISAAIKRQEADYLATLQAYSRPTRDQWEVQWIDGDDYITTFNGDPSLYRYWDATACAEFGFRIAQQALDGEMRQEAAFLARYDGIWGAANERFDVRNNDLAILVLSVLQNKGTLSQNRRKQFTGRVPEALFDFLEERARHHASASSPETTEEGQNRGV